MPEKKTKTTTKKVTEKKKAKRDMIEFFVDASQEESTVGVHFLEKLNKKGVKAKEVYNLLISWGYDDVRLEDVTKLLEIYRTKNKVKDGIAQMAY